MITNVSILGQQFGTNVQSGDVGWTVTRQKLCSQMIIHQDHSGKELCRHIAKPLTIMITQLPHQTVFIQLKMMEKETSIHLVKMA